jgi:putative flippase GtrA
MKLSRKIKRFLATGAVNTLVGYLIYAIGAMVFGLSYFWAVAASYVIGVSFSYLTFRTFVFAAGDRSLRSYPRFISAYVFLWAANVALLYVLVDVAGLHKLLAQAIAIGPVAALSFALNQVFVFRLGKINS